jgi:hypothetical protein
LRSSKLNSTLPTPPERGQAAPSAADLGPDTAADAPPLVQAVLRALSAEGPLARDDAAYLERDGQLRMAAAVAQAIEDRGALVVEAGTGVGKTSRTSSRCCSRAGARSSAPRPRTSRTSSSGATCRG